MENLDIPLLLDGLEKRLSEELPGLQGQLIMAPKRREDIDRTFKFKEEPRISSVLILLFNKGGQLTIPSILRSNYGGVHGGQISFPGGRKEDIDNDLWETALRETKEEIGIDASDSKLLGSLSELFIAVSNYKVKPYIAYSERSSFDYVPDGREVERVVEIPVFDYLNGKNRDKGKIITNRGFKIETPFFPLMEHKLWGASAMIFSELLLILDEIRAETA